MRILLLNRTLGLGGAERQAVVLARGLRGAGHEVGMAVFYSGGELEDEARHAVPVHDLAKRSRWESAGFLTRVARLVRRERPDIVHSFGHGPNLVTGVLRAALPRVKMVWGIRTSMQDWKAYGLLSSASARLEHLASSLPHAIIANSDAGRQNVSVHRRDRGSVFVIPNGIDCDAFRPDPEGRERLRREWGIPVDAEVVGIVARLDPVKDHATFLEAAALVAKERPGVRFVCVGTGPSDYAARLVRRARRLALERRLVWAGGRRATRAEYSAFDVAALSSARGEGFPNVVAEAMACGRPVAATDSGDARRIVGDTGQVVSSGDPAALARATLALLEGVRERGPEVSSRARGRIEQQFSVPALVAETARVLERVRAAP